MIKFLSDNRFNTYLYAPKDDPYHREKWRGDYPLPLREKLGELVLSCNSHSINFIFSVSPGLSIKYSDRNDCELLVRKLRSVIEMGTQWVGIMLDDTDTQLHFEEDKKEFASSLGKAHSYLLNMVSDELGKQYERLRLSFCPTYYANDYLGKKVQENEYLFDIGSGMDLHIDIFWTGRYVVPSTITEEDATSFERVIKRKPLLWDNYPVNDYFRSNGRNTGLRLNLGAFQGRAPEMLEHICGYLSNPMNECEASKISLLTLKDMLEQGSSYSPQASLENALRKLFGSGSSSNVLEEMKLLLEIARASPLYPIEATELGDLVAKVKSSYEKGAKEATWQASGLALKNYLEKCRMLKEKLQGSLAKNEKLFSELEPLLAKVEKLAVLGEDTLVYLEQKGEHRAAAAADSITATVEKLDQELADIRINYRTQVMGEVNFGTAKTSGGTDDEGLSDLGLPLFRSESPIIELYEWARDLP
jgi:hypothetical protein